MITIKWAGMEENLELSLFEPEKLQKYYYNDCTSNFARCPGFLNSIKNAFVIRAPYDISFTVDVENKRVAVINAPDNIRLRNRIEESPRDNNPVISIMVKYVFVVDTDVIMEVLPPFLEQELPFRVVPGRFNIGKWVRPTEYAFEVMKSGSYTIKRGQPLFYVRFTTNDETDIVKLSRVDYTKEFHSHVMQCTELKTYVPKLPLEKSYSLASVLDIKKLYKNLTAKKSGCPFHGFWK